MTSTSFNVGLVGDGSRASSRVLRPPGGGHTDIFGGDPEPPRGRRLAPPQPTTNFMGQGDEAKPTNGSVEAPQNGPEQPQVQAQTPEPVPEAKPEPVPEAKPEPKREPASFNQPEPVRAEPQKRVRVPPGGFSSGLCAGYRSMEGGGRSRLGRLLSRLRGDHHKSLYSLDKGISICSTAMSESTGCGSTVNEEDDLDPAVIQAPQLPNVPSGLSDDDNIDLRYGGQYMTAEQLPAFCDQLHHLVDVIRNIQSYAQITGEYPTELERRLEREAREVASLAAETRNARDVIQRTRLQRRALREHRTMLNEQLATLKDTEIRELESSIRLSDRKLFKNWETVKDSNDAAAFEPLIEEIRNKQTALECLMRLINGRRATLSKSAVPPQPLPPPMPRDTIDESIRRRGKRRRSREPRSAPLSGEPSAHAHLPQVTLYIQGPDTAGRRAGAVPITSLELPSGGSVRDILFFTTNSG